MKQKKPTQELGEEVTALQNWSPRSTHRLAFHTSDLQSHSSDSQTPSSPPGHTVSLFASGKTQSINIHTYTHVHTQSGASQVTVHTHRYLCAHLLQKLHGERQDFGGSKALPLSFGSVGLGEVRHSDDQKPQ